VAAAGCAPGTPLPEAILAAAGGSEPAATPKPRTGVSFSNVFFTVWAKVAGALTMVFYAVRGIFLLLGQLFSRPAKPAPAPAPAASRPPATPPVVHAGPAAGVAAPAPAAAPTPGHPAVSAGPGVTKVITPAKATIVPPAPAAAPPPPPPAPAPTEPAAAAPAASEPPAAANGKKKAAPPVVGGKAGKDDKAIEAAPTVSNEGRTKASARRGIRLKLIKPGENDSGLK
jgi:hypothetical protein